MGLDRLADDLTFEELEDGTVRYTFSIPVPSWMHDLTKEELDNICLEIEKGMLNAVDSKLDYYRKMILFHEAQRLAGQMDVFDYV